MSFYGSEQSGFGQLIDPSGEFSPRGSGCPTDGAVEFWQCTLTDLKPNVPKKRAGWPVNKKENRSLPSNENVSGSEFGKHGTEEASILVEVQQFHFHTEPQRTRRLIAFSNSRWSE